MPFIDPREMPTAEPLPGWKGRFPSDVPHSVRVLEGGRAFVANHPVRTDLR